MDIKEKLNSFKASVKKQVPSNLNLTSGDLKLPQFQINNLFNGGQETKSGLTNLNIRSDELIRYIQEKHIPIVQQYTRQKESREIHVNPCLKNPELEQEIINSIEKIYYSDLVDEESNDELSTVKQEQTLEERDAFDPFEHILNKLTDTMDLGFILVEKKNLEKQLSVVDKRVSDLIKQNQSTYNKEMASMIELQEILNDAINICSSGRFRLDIARKNLTYPNLNIISTYRRREILISMLKEFYTIKTLLQTELTLNDLMEDEDYVGAIKLCLECLKIIDSLNHYKCVTDLGEKMTKTIKLIEERLDQALAKLCINFSHNQFTKIKETFDLLGKTHFLYDQLLIHYLVAINEKTFNIVNSYVELCTDLNNSIASSTSSSLVKERNFEEVCSSLSFNCFLPCLVDVNKSMFHIMVNYNKFMNAHCNYKLKHMNSDKLDSNENSDLKANNEQELLDCDLTLIKQKMKSGLNRIWQEVESKLIILVRNHKLSIYSFDDFISMIKIVRKMIDIGCEFSNTKNSDQLEAALKKATSEYFYVYHKTKMEEIKVFLETELWQSIPMKSDFSIEQLHEFDFLKNKLHLIEKVGDIDEKSEGNYFEEEEKGSELVDSRNRETPFDRFMNCNRRDEIKDEEQVIVSEQFDTKDQEHTNTGEHKKDVERTEPVMITNSSLNILRIVGKYMQIMIILNQISFDVLLCIFHLFDYYLYGVYTFFGNDQTMLDNQFYTLSPNLLKLFKRIESTLIQNRNSVTSDNRMTFHAPQLSSIVNLNDRHHLFGLLERAIGVESLVFLAAQLNKIYEPLLSLINENDKGWLEQFFKQTVNVSPELRELVYMQVANRYIRHEQIVQEMEKINWEVREEIRSEHNSYVDDLIQDLRMFRRKETDLIQFCCKSSHQSSQALWTQLLKLVNFIFIEGFSRAKKCTNEGRALMKLDYQNFLYKIAQVVSIKSIPNKELVEEYVKAYYYTEEQLENLIKCKKREYTIKQLKSLLLLNCALNDNKKGRQRLLALIDTECASPSK